MGNVLLRDDGVGVHAVRRFRQSLSWSGVAAEIGTAVFDAVHLIEQADRILAFDAVQAGGVPGSVYRFRARDASSGERRASVHEMGLLHVLRTLDRPPSEVVIIGAEPEIIDWGMELSPAVDLALPFMIAAADQVIAGWRRHDRRIGAIAGCRL